MMMEDDDDEYDDDEIDHSLLLSSNQEGSPFRISLEGDDDDDAGLSAWE